MVTKITVPASIKRALNYNEQKMRKGKAECIYAHNFLKTADKLNFYDKLNRFERLIELNKRATTNAVHISLNFSEHENLRREKLAEIATSYMEKIGFGVQPYLVYQHHDAGHPHIHVVTTNIQMDGRRISLHNIGRNQSTKARKEIEVQIKLLKAEDQKNLPPEIIPVWLQKLAYGKAPTKKAITNIIESVVANYKFSSLPEFNAVLKLYNLYADRGTPEGLLFKKKGLLYRVLDEKGKPIGVPIKASSIYSKPTLHFLEQKFKENEPLKLPFKKQIETRLDWILLKPLISLERFKESLARENISLVIRQNEHGMVYGLTYIDHGSKCVFNGSDLGKPYNAKAILEKCKVLSGNGDQSEQPIMIHELRELEVKHQSNRAALTAIYAELPKMHPTHSEPDLTTTNPLEALLTPINCFDYLPYNLKKSKKKKRKR